MPAADGFVGRTAEGAALAEEMDRVHTGDPRVVWLSGRAGIGKTSLLRRFVSRCVDDEPGTTVLWAGGDGVEAGLPFGVLAQVVAGLPARLVQRSPLLAAGPPDDADPLAVGAELLAALRVVQACGVVVLVVDDAHWADDLSAQALVFVVRRLRRDRVLFLLGVLSEAAPEPASWARALAQAHLVRTLPLGGLSDADMVSLSAAVGGPTLTPAAGRRLREHTGGHPMHARALIEELPAAALTDTSAVLPAPRSLAALVLVRVSKLTAPAQQLVLAAAVLGTRSALPDVVALADVGDPLRALGEAVAAGLIEEVPSGSGHDVVFAHPLVRAAVCADLPPVRLHVLHRAAGELLGGPASISHRIAAAAGPDPGLAAELEELGHRELARRRWGPAADHLLAAADLSPTYGSRARRRIDAVGAMVAGGDIARSRRNEADVRAAPPSSGRSRVLGQLAVLTGRFAVARAELSAAMEQAAGRHDRDRSVAAAYLGLLSLIQGRPGEAADLAEEALRTPSPDIVAMARFVRIVGSAVEGGHAAAGAAVDERDGEGGRSPHPTAETDALRGLLALWSDDVAGAAAALSAVVRDEMPGMPMQGRILVLGHLAEAEYRLGDWDEASAHAEFAVSLAQDAGALLGDSTTHAIASYVASGRGLWEMARTRVGTAVAAADALPWWGARAYAATARATLAQATGDHLGMKEALRPFTDPGVVALVDGMGVVHWRAMQVESMLGLGLVREADDALGELESRVAQRPAGWSALEAVRLRALREEMRGDPAGARAAYEHGMELADGARATLSRARLETAYGRHLLGSGERRPAVDVLRAAHGRLERLGAVPFLAVCDDLLRAAGLHPPRTGDALGLTTQETAVARAVARGRTNQETAAELYVTSRTVAFHLSNIYAKLGISSRRDLAAHLPGPHTRPGTGRSAGRS